MHAFVVHHQVDQSVPQSAFMLLRLLAVSLAESSVKLVYKVGKLGCLILTSSI